MHIEFYSGVIMYNYVKHQGSGVREDDLKHLIPKIPYHVKCDFTFIKAYIFFKAAFPLAIPIFTNPVPT